MRPPPLQVRGSADDRGSPRAARHTRGKSHRPHRDVCAKADPELAVGEIFDVPRPFARKTWADGDTWHRRGRGLLSPKRARKLLSRADTTLMHVFGGAAHEHVGPAREGLVAKLEEFWAGNADPRSTFELGEFRDNADNVMVMIVEGC